MPPPADVPGGRDRGSIFRAVMDLQEVLERVAREDASHPLQRILLEQWRMSLVRAAGAYLLGEAEGLDQLALTTDLFSALWSPPSPPSAGPGGPDI